MTYTPQPDRFYWDNESTQIFLKYLKSEEAIRRFKTIQEIDNANNMIAEINDALKTFAIKCKIKVSKSRVIKPTNIKLGMIRNALILS